MKVQPDRINLITGSGGKNMKSIIEESGVEGIDTEDNGTVKITAKDLSSLERSKAIINNLTMVPTIGDIYRNCEIKSIAPYGVFVEIAPGRENTMPLLKAMTWDMANRDKESTDPAAVINLKFRKLFPLTKWATEFNAALTVPFFHWLVGPSENIRKARAKTLGFGSEARCNYSEMDYVREELEFARRLFAQNPA